MKHLASLLLGCRRFRSDLAIITLKSVSLLGDGGWSTFQIGKRF